MTAQDTGAHRLQVTLYTKSGCHLCDDLWDELRAIQGELDFTVVERDIERDPTDFDRFRNLVPVLDVPGRGYLYPPHDVNTVRQAIASAVYTAGPAA